MTGEGRMNGDGVPTDADVEAMRALWAGLGGLDPLGTGRVHSTYSDGRIVIPEPGAEAARDFGEAARAREEGHREAREALMLAVAEARAQGVPLGPGPWAPYNPATQGGREGLRRSGFEERYGDDGAVWVRPADGEVFKARHPGFFVPFDEDADRGGSG